MAQAGTFDEAQAGLTQALRNARAAEAAHLDARLAMSDAKALRLQVLKDELAPFVAAAPETREAFELVVTPGDPPRLWIDLITSVVMEPDPRTYRLLRDSQSGRDVLFETADRGEMLEKVKLCIAHGLIARRRLAADGAPTESHVAQYSAASLILAWLAGFALGALALLGFAIYLKILKF